MPLRVSKAVTIQPALEFDEAVPITAVGGAAAATAVETRAKTTSKRRQSLSYEELNALAVEAGVEDLYQYAVATFERVLQRGSTQSSVRFAAVLDGGRKTIISLVPEESSVVEGLRYRIYKNRFAALAGLADIAHLMPPRHHDWSRGDTQDPNWDGLEGYITSREEVDRIAGALKQGPRAAQ